ncbi:hypothetical protein T08_9996 [Trichinella sp. T8]|nr:hypothetical protein T08_9996 [Trichinella sp. T8]
MNTNVKDTFENFHVKETEKDAEIRFAGRNEN